MPEKGRLNGGPGGSALTDIFNGLDWPTGKFQPLISNAFFWDWLTWFLGKLFRRGNWHIPEAKYWFSFSNGIAKFTCNKIGTVVFRSACPWTPRVGRSPRKNADVQGDAHWVRPNLEFHPPLRAWFDSRRHCTLSRNIKHPIAISENTSLQYV